MTKTILSIIMIVSALNLVFAQVDVEYTKLVWSDEFGGNGAIDASKWHHQTLLPNGNSWYNGEVQHYTDRTDNSFVQNGNLHIVAKRENFNHQGVTKDFTSARLNSKFAFTYGRVDVRAKMAIEKGTWPAIWMLGRNITEPGGYFTSQYGTTPWPACGEIDIMEYGIYANNYIGSAIHTTSSFGSTVNKGGKIATNLGADFHIYSMNWSENQITFLLDSQVFYTYKPSVKDMQTWPFDSPQYILLNIAMGGVVGQVPAVFSQDEMVIDYVRVYQKEDAVPKDTSTKDTIHPQNFVAAIGEVSSRGIELKFSASDTSDPIEYVITYLNQELKLIGNTGLEKTTTIYGLSPSTEYTFSIFAQDRLGNKTPVKVLKASTTASKLICAGASTNAQQGTFSQGYRYGFEPVGNELYIEFELLDTDKTGVEAFLQTQIPFSEITPFSRSSNRFTFRIQGLNDGERRDFALRFAYAGGNSTTTFYPYSFKENCTSSIEDISKPELSFQNPTTNFLRFFTKEPFEEIRLYDFLGQKVFESSDFSNSYDVSHLPSGMYQLMVTYRGDSYFHKLIINR